MNSNIQKHLDQKQNQLTQLEETLKNIQEQLNLVQQQIRVESQIQKAQTTIFNEFKAHKQAIGKLLKDACSCFDVEAIDDFVEDIKQIAEDVKEEYDKHAQSDRFLAGSDDLEPDLDIPTLPEILAPTDEITTYLESVPEASLEVLKQMFKLTRIKTLSRIVLALKQKGLTVDNLRAIIDNLAPPSTDTPLLLETNGHTK